MNKILPKFLYALLGLCSLGVGSSQAQIAVQDNRTAQQLVDQFIGSNVAIFNPTLDCATTSNGTFEVINSLLPIGEGIILGTGDAIGAGFPGSVFLNQSNQGNSDPDLQDIASGNVTSTCVLEFDFVPDIDTTSTVRFNYSFASEEYPEFACSGFNDIFAFFITGPGGGMTNIALVPGTSIPVAINSINSAPANTSYPISTCNALGPGSPFTNLYLDNFTAPDQFFVFDGLTKNLEAIATVTPCDTFHMKLAIGNVGDDGFQSAVFLEKNSFRVDDVKLDFTQIVEVDSGYLAEGCNSSSFIAYRDTTTTRPKKLCFTYSGTAINGVDYSLLPDTLILPPNQPSVTVPIVPFQDNMSEPGYETIIVTRVNCCTGTPMSAVELRIFDSLQITLNNVDTGMCGGAPIELSVSGAPQFSYAWTPVAYGSIQNPTDTVTMAFPEFSTTYTVTASFLSCPPVSKSFDVTVEPIPVVDIHTEDTTICLSAPMQLKVDVQPDTFLQYTYVWGPNFGLDDPFAKEPFYYYATPADYKYILAVQTPLGCTGKDSIIIRSKPAADLVNVTADQTVKYGESVQLNAEGATYYVWNPTKFLDFPTVQDPVATPTDTVTYQVIGVNEFGCKDTAYVKIDIDYNMVEIVPNAFTPNGDGRNDVFRIKNVRYQKLQEFRVFNRYGQEVFSTTNPADGWDGTFNGVAQEVGVYHYLVRIAIPGGQTKTYKGDISLLR